MVPIYSHQASTQCFQVHHKQCYRLMLIVPTDLQLDHKFQKERALHYHRDPKGQPVKLTYHFLGLHNQGR